MGERGGWSQSMKRERCINSRAAVKDKVLIMVCANTPVTFGNLGGLNKGEQLVCEITSLESSILALFTMQNVKED